MYNYLNTYGVLIMKTHHQLHQIAFMQGGLFTAKQAESCGYIRSNHHYHIKTGHWVKEGWGVYRLAHIPVDEMTSYWELLLWSHNGESEPMAVFSHQTALSFYELSDVNPSKITITVPKKFQKRSRPIKALRICKKDLSKKDIKQLKGLPVTAPMRTLLDIHEEESLPENLIEQAVKEALEKGFIRKSDLKKNPELARYAL